MWSILNTWLYGEVQRLFIWSKVTNKYGLRVRIDCPSTHFLHPIWGYHNGYFQDLDYEDLIGMIKKHLINHPKWVYCLGFLYYYVQFLGPIGLGPETAPYWRRAIRLKHIFFSGGPLEKIKYWTSRRYFMTMDLMTCSVHLILWSSGIKYRTWEPGIFDLIGKYIRTRHPLCSERLCP